MHRNEINSTDAKDSGIEQRKERAKQTAEKTLLAGMRDAHGRCHKVRSSEPNVGYICKNALKRNMTTMFRIWKYIVIPILTE